MFKVHVYNTTIFGSWAQQKQKVQPYKDYQNIYIFQSNLLYGKSIRGHVEWPYLC